MNEDEDNENDPEIKELFEMNQKDYEMYLNEDLLDDIKERINKELEVK